MAALRQYDRPDDDPGQSIRHPAPPGLQTKEATHPSGILPLEYKVLVRPGEIEVDPVIASAKAAGLQLPPGTIEREMMAQIVSTFVAKGGNAFEDWKDRRLPTEGDSVLMAKYVGIPLKGADGVEYRLVNDKDISAIVTSEGVSRV